MMVILSYATELVQAIVQTIADMEYGGLWAKPPLQIGDTDWSPTWIILFHDATAGVGKMSCRREKLPSPQKRRCSSPYFDSKIPADQAVPLFP